jgi:ABC-type phosphate/phosphonate transport system substrate-binding protein
MKKIGVIMVLAVAITALLVCPMRAAEKKVYTLGLRYGVGNSLDAQFTTIVSDIAKAFNLNNEEQLKVVIFNDDKKFMEAADKDELDFIYTISFDTLNSILERNIYSPFVATALFGATEENYCVYIKKDNPAKDINGLRKGQAMITGTAFDYYLLRDIVGENPDNIFSQIIMSPNNMSNIYSLAMDDSEVATALDVVINTLKQANPGPTKKIRIFACRPISHLMPFLRSKRVPMELVDRITMFLNAAPNNKALKNYQWLMKTYKLKFIPVTYKDYEPLTKLYGDARKKGWDKDYEHWIKYAKEIK